MAKANIPHFVRFIIFYSLLLFCISLIIRMEKENPCMIFLFFFELKFACFTLCFGTRFLAYAFPKAASTP